jgi:hypothetical protein
VSEAIMRAAAEDAAGAEAPEPPLDAEGNSQPQRDRLTRSLLEAIAQLPSRLDVKQTGGTVRCKSDAGLGTTAFPLVQKVAALAMNEAEREGVRILLGMAASSLACGSEKLPPPHISAPQVFSVAMEALRLLLPHHERIPSNGTVWRGRPAFFTQAVLEELQAEAAQGRGRAIQLKSRSLAWAGRVGTQLTHSAALIDFVKAHAGNCKPTGRTAYAYYDSPGNYVYRHVDYSSYALTAVFMVRHDHRHAPQSRHLHFLADGRTECVDLQPGEMLLFYGGCVVHGRTPVAREEAVVVLTVGFRPL